MDKTSFTANKNVVTITRVFDASREKLYTAFIDPAYIPRWWGPEAYTTTVEKMDVRPGGAWRFVQKDKEGKVFAFNGVFKEVKEPEKIVQTFTYEAEPEKSSTQTAVLADMKGKTKLTIRVVFHTEEDLKSMVEKQMEWGERQSMERLANLVEKPGA